MWIVRCLSFLLSLQSINHIRQHYDYKSNISRNYAAACDYRIYSWLRQFIRHRITSLAHSNCSFYVLFTCCDSCREDWRNLGSKSIFICGSFSIRMDRNLLIHRLDASLHNLRIPHTSGGYGLQHNLQQGSEMPVRHRTWPRNANSDPSGDVHSDFINHSADILIYTFNIQCVLHENDDIM